MWEKLLVTSSKNIGPRVIFGPGARDHEPITLPIHWLCVSGTSDIFSFWDHVILWIIARATICWASPSLIQQMSTSAHRYRRPVKSKPWKTLSDRGWPIWLPAVWTHLCGLCTTRVFCSGYSGFSIAIPRHTRVLDCFVSLDVGVLGRQSGEGSEEANGEQITEPSEKFSCFFL